MFIAILNVTQTIQKDFIVNERFKSKGEQLNFIGVLKFLIVNVFACVVVSN